jgi:hypothetical protein
MAKAKRDADRKRSGRSQPPGLVLIFMIASFSIGTLLICAQVARLVYASGITGDIRSRLQADYRPWTPEAFAPVSTGIALGTPDPIKGSQSLLEATATQTCAPSAETCDPPQPTSTDAAASATSAATRAPGQQGLPGVDGADSSPPSTP